jgi:hypothetical protein
MSEEKMAIVTEESQSGRYAVIGLRWNEVFPELVIAHCDEESLPGLITAPSIIGIGFSSREAAAGFIPNQSPRQFLRRKLSRTGRMARATLQHAIAVGVLLFYSKSILGAAIRACVGA